ncbi:hypothetical protein PDJAM_G00223150 [Pangasius djambal]|uniref:Uncharacterized protein n=1 Tax=Pangasius djambal TaxID=1691987 RepID=A0ACC5YCN4_9TELE|nr:hypothetical protein [Pangasius djambal]
MVQFEGSQAPGTFYISVYILIAVGAVMMFVGFLGCYGAIQESQCLLGTFFTCLVILFACEVAAAIWGFISRDTISEELINFYDAAYMKSVDPVETPTRQAASKVLLAFHGTFSEERTERDDLTRSLAKPLLESNPNHRRDCRFPILSLTHQD